MRKQAQPGLQYLQRSNIGGVGNHLTNICLQVVFGKKSDLIVLLGKSIAHVKRCRLTARLFNSHLMRKTLTFSKDLTIHRAAVTWQGSYYNLIRPHQSLRFPAEDDTRQRWQK